MLRHTHPSRATGPFDFNDTNSFPTNREEPVYVAGVCQAPPVSVGRSVLVDPMGVVEADLGPAAGVRAVEVPLETVDRVRESFPMFRQRRL